MWICGNKGFLSIVGINDADWNEAVRRRLLPSGANRDEYLVVRARNANHITATFPHAKVVMKWSRWTDYPARAFMLREGVAAVIAQQVENIDYSNFKDSVKNHPLHDAYMAVWTVMNDYGRGKFGKKRIAPQFPFDDGDPASDYASDDYHPRHWPKR